MIPKRVDGKDTCYLDDASESLVGISNLADITIQIKESCLK